MNIHIATVFDKQYLVRALALYKSAKCHIPHSQIWTLCLDKESKYLLDSLNYKDLHTKLVEDLGDHELMSTQANRTRGEFAFTTKAAWLDYLIKSHCVAHGDILILADADILFYRHINKYLQDWQNHSIGITPHNFPKQKKYKEKSFGIYNAGMAIFTVDNQSKLCIEDWRKSVIKWCFARSEDGKFADQAYLNEWPHTYKGVYDIPDPGINAGPWNIENYMIKKDAEDDFTINGKPLMAYHFHGAKPYLDKDTVKFSPVYILHTTLYRSYARKIQQAYNIVKTVSPNWESGFEEKPSAVRIAKQHIFRLGNKFLTFLQTKK